MEAKGKFEEALINYTVHFYVEQSNGQVPSSSQKVEDISKIIAIKKAAKNFDALLKESYERSGGFEDESKSEPLRDLPSKTYCRSRGAFPSIYKWKSKFVKPEMELQELTDRFSSMGVGPEKDALQLEIVTCALAAENYRVAFNYLNKSIPMNKDGIDEDVEKGLKKLRAHLRGLEMHLRCNLGAQDNFRGAESLSKGDLELVMLQAHVQLGLGKTEEALALLNDGVIKLLLSQKLHKRVLTGIWPRSFP